MADSTMKKENESPTIAQWLTEPKYSLKTKSKQELLSKQGAQI
jgi:hypothetical protein